MLRICLGTYQFHYGIIKYQLKEVNLITVSNFKTVEVLEKLFSSALTRFENLLDDKDYLPNLNLTYYKVTIQWVNTFHNLGFFTEVDEVIYFLEKPHKWQEEVYIIDALGLTSIFNQDYTEWLQENDIPKDCQQDVIEVIGYILHNHFNVYCLKDIIEDLKNDFQV